MSKKHFKNLLESIEQAGAVRRGETKASRETVIPAIDVKAIRKQLGRSQASFALMIGVSIATLQNWEQGRRQPDGPARALLMVASKNPKAVADAIAS